MWNDNIKIAILALIMQAVFRIGYKIKRLRLWIAVVLLVAAALAFGAPLGIAHADTNDFVITNFTSNETLTKADPQGELHIVERISVNFTDNNHGITRAIPNSYKGNSLQFHLNSVTSTSGAPTEVSTSTQNGNTVLRIGNPNRTVTGPQEYTIDYTLKNVITFYKDHDELYWDVNGDQWDQSAELVKTTLVVPDGIKLAPQGLACYTGDYGSKASDCTIQMSGNQIQASATNLAPNQTLTYVVGFQTGYFTPYSWYDKLHKYLIPLAEAVLLPLVVFCIAFWYWLKNGRDARGTGIIVPQYDTPDGLRPLEVGTIIDFKVDNRDITATIIDLAVRRYIKIIEAKHDHLLRKDTQTYTLELTNADSSNLNSNERAIIGAIFPQNTVGEQASLSDLKNKFYTTAKSVRENVEFMLTTLGYFRKNPLKSGKVLKFFFPVVVIFLIYSGAHFGVALAFGILAAAVIAYLFGRAMPSRTAKGVAADEHIQGLKLYLKVAEAARLQKLQSPNAPYGEQTGEPVKTVQLFEKLLPYAMVLSVEKEWAKQFETIYTVAPDWYVGNWATFNAVYLATSLNVGMLNATSAVFSAPSSSGGSGFGGGGFAGGGGGGGGGGGW